MGKVKIIHYANGKWVLWNGFLQYKAGQTSPRQSLLPVC